MSGEQGVLEHLIHEYGEQLVALENSADIEAAFHPIINFLIESETKLIDLMEGKQPPDSQKGSVEFGMMLYWIHNDLPKPLQWIAKYFPLPQITAPMLQKWKVILDGAGIVASDGTLVSYATYAQLDPGWKEAGIYYILLKLGIVKKQDFGTPGNVTSFSGDSLSIAVIGDWGTGKYVDGADADGPAIAIMDQAAAMNPDLTIHLGDVYYVGNVIREPLNFLNIWQPGSQGSFTLNSNHEMYPGGTGYFKDAMKRQMFSAQQKSSCFAFTFADWIVIGLDSAYDIDFPINTLTPFLLEGRITDSTQQEFVKNLDLTNKKVIVMTHHTGTDVPGLETYKLWDDVTGMLKANPTFVQNKLGPDYWYWGHVHNGIVYSSGSIVGGITKTRCVGHGAIPFGKGYGIGTAETDYFAQTPYSNYATPTEQQKNRVLNGFAMLNFDAKTGTMTEEFYEQGNTTPVWTGKSS